MDDEKLAKGQPYRHEEFNSYIRIEDALKTVFDKSNKKIIIIS